MNFFKKNTNDDARKYLSKIMLSFGQIENKFLPENYTADPLRESLNTMDDVMLDPEEFTEYHISLI